MLEIFKCGTIAIVLIAVAYTIVINVRKSYRNLLSATKMKDVVPIVAPQIFSYVSLALLNVITNVWLQNSNLLIGKTIAQGVSAVSTSIVTVIAISFFSVGVAPLLLLPAHITYIHCKKPYLVAWRSYLISLVAAVLYYIVIPPFTSALIELCNATSDATLYAAPYGMGCVLFFCFCCNNKENEKSE